MEEISTPVEVSHEEVSLSSVIPTKMKAIPFLETMNDPTVMKIMEWDVPKIDENEVLIQVKAFGLNFADISARKGQYNDAPPYPWVPGYEVSGIVAAVGSNVDHVKVGDKVIAGTFRFGGYAQYAKTLKEGVMHLPKGWTFAQGASVIVNFITAWHALTQTGSIFPGDRVLIHAAAGGVGLAAIQVAQHLKLEVFGTCGSADKVAFLKEKGIKDPVNYRSSDFETEIKRLTNNEGVDIVLDSVAGNYLKKDMNILRANGRIVGIGAAALNDRSLGNIISFLGGVISMSTFSTIDLLLGSKGFYGVNMKVISEHKRPLLKKEFEELMSLFDQGILKPDLIQELPWDQVAKGHQLLESRKSTGKIVMIVN